jgi:hypothetical protein
MDEAPAMILLDDIDAALSRLTDFGRAIIAPAARQIQDALLCHAALKNWSVIRHGDFATWALDQIDPDLLWIVLDPLLSLRPDMKTVAGVRVSRVVTENAWEFDVQMPENFRFVMEGALVGIVEDVVHTGMTIRCAMEVIARVGGQVDDVIVAASTRSGAAVVRANSPELSWIQYCRVDATTIHARDACPFLPFAGRRAFDKPAVRTPVGNVDVRVPITAFRTGAWAEVTADRSVAAALNAARRGITGRFSSALGRVAQVGDVPLLGQGVSLPLLRPQTATAQTPLKSLLG